MSAVREAVAKAIWHARFDWEYRRSRPSMVWEKQKEPTRAIWLRCADAAIKAVCAEQEKVK